MTAKHISNFDDPGHEPLPRQPASPQRILVVENGRNFRQPTAKVLIGAGYQVEVADDGAAGWCALQLSRYDLLITDQFMPKLSGTGLIMKSRAARMILPIIMVTGFLPAWEFTLHTWLQPVKMLRKPYADEKLLGLVKNVLHQAASAGADLQLIPENLRLRATLVAPRLKETLDYGRGGKNE
jgi:DNA-binding response OmpR family regulator